MRKHRKTIAGLANQMNITQSRVNYVRKHGVQGQAFVRDWREAIEGESRKVNPMKKATPAQIAARKLFAERARAGTLRNGGKRKANPAKAAKPAVKKAAPRKNPIRTMKSNTRFAREDKAASLRLRKKSESRQREVKGEKMPYVVQWASVGSDWKTLAKFATAKDAKQYARSYAKAYPRFSVRVTN